MCHVRWQLPFPINPVTGLVFPAISSQSWFQNSSVEGAAAAPGPSRPCPGGVGGARGGARLQDTPRVPGPFEEKAPGWHRTRPCFGSSDICTQEDCVIRGLGN